MTDGNLSFKNDRNFPIDTSQDIGVVKVSFKFVFLLFYVSIGSFSCALMEQFLSLWNCSLLKETVYRHGTVAVHLCVLLPFIKEPAFMTSCSLAWVAKSSKIDLLMRKNLF